ncbi:MAG TPA: hypothetical protein ACQGQH_06720 [Xylella sp.]
MNNQDAADHESQHTTADINTLGIQDSVEAVTGAGRATLASAKATVRALHLLLLSDLKMAWSALCHALTWACMIIILGVSSWLLLTCMTIVLLEYIGLPWLASLILTALGNLIMTGLAIWRMMHYLRHTGLHATRRQLLRLTMLDETEDGATPTAEENRP